MSAATDDAADGPLVLLVDDDAAIRRSVAVGLELEGFRVISASGGRAALEAVERVRPAVVLLDLTMPDLDGLEVGADDYVVKPFAVEEVAARLNALLRRRPGAASRSVLRVGDIELDARGHRATRDGRELELTPREFALLEVFLRRPGEVLDRALLHEEVWGYTFDPGTNVTDVFVGYLRRKLEGGGEPRVLHTVRGVGFVLRP